VERGPGCGADFMFEAAPRPAAGTNVDERRTVALLPSPPEDAIAFELNDFSLSISRARLTTMIARAPTSWKTEAERLTMIAGHRAKQLMAAAGRAVSSSDASHLLLQLIERGHVHIRHTSSGRTVRLAYIRYTGHRAGPMSGRGMITVSDRPDGAAFLHVDWWVS
jgi:hypothetical protein